VFHNAVLNSTVFNITQNSSVSDNRCIIHLSVSAETGDGDAAELSTSLTVCFI